MAMSLIPYLLFGQDQYRECKNSRSRISTKTESHRVYLTCALGLGRDLNMTPDQYNMTLTIFFITYSIFGNSRMGDNLIDQRYLQISF